MELLKLMINLNNPIIQVLLLILISFMCSFSKELNDYAKHPYKENAFLMFVSEVILSGVCGVLIGVLTKYMINNIYLIIFFTGVGGIFGIQSLRIGVKILMSLKNINISDESIEELEDKESNKKHNTYKNDDRRHYKRRR